MYSTKTSKSISQKNYDYVKNASPPRIVKGSRNPPYAKTLCK